MCNVCGCGQYGVFFRVEGMKRNRTMLCTIFPNAEKAIEYRATLIKDGYEGKKVTYIQVSPARK